MSEISVRFEALEVGAAGIRAHYLRLTATIQQLETELQPMITSWSGAAQQSYVACAKEWNDAATALAQVLRGIGQAVGDAHQNYVSAEAAARATWS